MERSVINYSAILHGHNPRPGRTVLMESNIHEGTFNNAEHYFINVFAYASYSMTKSM